MRSGVHGTFARDTKSPQQDDAHCVVSRSYCCEPCRKQSRFRQADARRGKRAPSASRDLLHPRYRYIRRVPLGLFSRQGNALLVSSVIILNRGIIGIRRED